MNERYFNFISLAFLLIGIVFIANYSFNLVGATIGISPEYYKLNFIFGETFVLLAIISSPVGRKTFNKLEKKLINISLAVIFSLYAGLSINVHFIPRETEAIIQKVNYESYNGKKVYVIETNQGRFRNEDSSIYGKNNSEELQKIAKELEGKKVKIKNYGYTKSFESIEYPKRNILDIKKY